MVQKVGLAGLCVQKKYSQRTIQPRKADAQNFELVRGKFLPPLDERIFVISG
jgi:hypothetical protein